MSLPAFPPPVKMNLMMYWKQGLGRTVGNRTPCSWCEERVQTDYCKTLHRWVYARKNSQSLCPLQSAIQRANSLWMGRPNELRPYLYRALLQTGRTEGKTVYSSGRWPNKRPILFSMETSSGDTSTFSLSTGTYTKQEVREYLRQKGFEAKARGGESMEICFIEGDYRNFLRSQCPDIDTQVGPDGL